MTEELPLGPLATSHRFADAIASWDGDAVSCFLAQGPLLFIGTRTVEYYLHKVFAKLEISSRNELGRVFPSEAREAQAV